MSQDTPYNSGGFGTTTGFETGNSGSGMSSNSGGTSTGATSSMAGGTHSDVGTCPTCGQSTGGGLEQFLGRIGISDDMVNNLKTSFSNVDIDEYLNTAREYLKGGGGKATTYAKDNPGKIAAGVAVLAVGAGLLINSMREKQ
jgi:hypothetical protein